MRGTLSPLWRPTLLRRVMLALLGAFCLVALALLVRDFVDYKRTMAERPGVRLLTDTLSASLAPLSDAHDASLIVSTRSEEFNRQRRLSGLLPGELLFQLQDLTRAETIWRSAGLQVPLQALPASNGPISVLTVAGRRYWASQAEGGRWRLTVLEPSLSDVTVMQWMGSELIVSMLIALPLVMLPLWIAVRQGMRPLKQLAALISGRSAQDLSPLGFTPRHEELKPLCSAFDQLLERMRQQQLRERGFVQDAAHELRTPMAVVATQAHVLSHASDPLEREQAAQALQQALQRASHLSRQLLTLATLDERSSDAAESLDLVDLVEQLLAQLAPQALAKAQDLSLDAPAKLPALVTRTAFESVLVNLVENAIRYVPDGGRIVVTLSQQPEGALLRVADDGPGIAPDLRASAFERFWRGAQSGEVSGSGLGLAIVRQAAGQLNARLDAEDGLEGRGIAFVLQLPSAA